MITRSHEAPSPSSASPFSATASAEAGWKLLVLLLVSAKPSIPIIEERSPPFFRYGDTLVLKGNLEQPPVLEEFDWREHLAREGVHYLMFRPEVELTGGGGGLRALGWVYRVREEMAASLGRSLPEPRASLAQALLLGIRGEDFPRSSGRTSQRPAPPT